MDTIFHQPEIRWLEGYSPNKPPFGVRACEVVIIHPDVSNGCKMEIF